MTFLCLLLYIASEFTEHAYLNHLIFSIIMNLLSIAKEYILKRADDPAIYTCSFKDLDPYGIIDKFITILKFILFDLYMFYFTFILVIKKLRR